MYLTSYLLKSLLPLPSTQSYIFKDFTKKSNDFSFQFDTEYTTFYEQNI